MVDHDDTAIVWADTSPAQNASVAANADAMVVPELDLPVIVAATQTALEAHDIPAQWVTAAMTYRQALRIMIGMAQLIQRTEGLGLKVKPAGKLDLTLSQLSAATRQILADASDSLKLDRSEITGSTTLREALRIAGQQFAQRRDIRLGDL